MNHIRHLSKLSDDERGMLEEFAVHWSELGVERVERIEGEPASFPFVYLDVGKGSYAAIAWLIFTFGGAGGAFLLKSFFESIGSELGKKVVDYWSKKEEKESRARYPCAVVYEVQPKHIVVVPIVSTTDPSFGRLHLLPEVIENDGRLRLGNLARLCAYYDVTSGQWELVHTNYEELPRKT